MLPGKDYKDREHVDGAADVERKLRLIAEFEHVKRQVHGVLDLISVFRMGWQAALDEKDEKDDQGGENNDQGDKKDDQGGKNNGHGDKDDGKEDTDNENEDEDEQDSDEEDVSHLELRGGTSPPLGRSPKRRRLLSKSYYPLK
tara:strand:+ start:5726 stop:6154 length:429 start_codon:yes stop_codon:yes gene_type:complete